MPRGIRNSNPGNIRLTRIAWKGMSAIQTDNDFVQFDDPVMGLRAIGVILRTYWENVGINTVKGAIDRWAPPVENDTDAYCEDVCAHLGVGPDDPVDLKTAMPQLIPAIVYHENGVQPYSQDQINQAVALAWA